MIFKRGVAKFRAQDWSADLIELGIVILCVCIGTWVANRNQAQAERDDTILLLNRFKPESQYQVCGSACKRDPVIGVIGVQ